MARPRKSTRDEWLDTFAAWDERDRDVALELAEWIHKHENKSMARKATKKEDADGPQQQQDL